MNVATATACFASATPTTMVPYGLIDETDFAFAADEEGPRGPWSMSGDPEPSFAKRVKPHPLGKAKTKTFQRVGPSFSCGQAATQRTERIAKDVRLIQVAVWAERRRHRRNDIPRARSFELVERTERRKMLEHFRRPHDVERTRTEGQRLDRCLYYEDVPDVPEPMQKTLHSGHVIVDGDHAACPQQKMRHVFAAARADVEGEARFAEARDKPALLPDRGIAASCRASAFGGQAPLGDRGRRCGLTRGALQDLDVALPGEFVSNAAKGVLAEAPVTHGIVEEVADLSGEVLYVVRSCEQSGLAVLDRYRGSTVSPRDDRKSVGHRFEDAQPEIFLRRRVDVDRGLAIEAGQATIADLAEERHLIAHAELSGEYRELPGVAGEATGDHEMDVARVVTAQKVKRTDREVEPFLRIVAVRQKYVRLRDHGPAHRDLPDIEVAAVTVLR